MKKHFLKKKHFVSRRKYHRKNKITRKIMRGGDPEWQKYKTGREKYNTMTPVDRVKEYIRFLNTHKDNILKSLDPDEDYLLDVIVKENDIKKVQPDTITKNANETNEEFETRKRDYEATPHLSTEEWNEYKNLIGQNTQWFNNKMTDVAKKRENLDKAEAEFNRAGNFFNPGAKNMLNTTLRGKNVEKLRDNSRETQLKELEEKSKLKALEEESKLKALEEKSKLKAPEEESNLKALEEEKFVHTPLDEKLNDSIIEKLDNNEEQNLAKLGLSDADAIKIKLYESKTEPTAEETAEYEANKEKVRLIKEEKTALETEMKTYNDEIKKYIEKPKNIDVGVTVRANRKNEGTIYRGKISAVNTDGSFNVNYDDGTIEKNLNINMIKPTLTQEQEEEEAKIFKKIEETQNKLQTFTYNLDIMRSLNSKIVSYEQHHIKSPEQTTEYERLKKLQKLGELENGQVKKQEFSKEENEYIENLKKSVILFPRKKKVKKEIDQVVKDEQGEVVKDQYGKEITEKVEIDAFEKNECPYKTHELQTIYQLVNSITTAKMDDIKTKLTTDDALIQGIIQKNVETDYGINIKSDLVSGVNQYAKELPKKPKITVVVGPEYLSSPYFDGPESIKKGGGKKHQKVA